MCTDKTILLKKNNFTDFEINKNRKINPSISYYRYYTIILDILNLSKVDNCLENLNQCSCCFGCNCLLCL